MVVGFMVVMLSEALVRFTSNESLICRSGFDSKREKKRLSLFEKLLKVQ